MLTGRIQALGLEDMLLEMLCSGCSCCCDSSSTSPEVASLSIALLQTSLTTSPISVIDDLIDLSAFLEPTTTDLSIIWVKHKRESTDRSYCAKTPHTAASLTRSCPCCC